MVSRLAKVLFADAVFLVAEFFILQDLGWRGTYASSKLGYTSSYSFSLLTQFFDMAGRGGSLQSPPTLDWVQLLLVVLGVVNTWYVYGALRRRRGVRPP